MSLTKNSDLAYSVVAKTFHWVMAVLIIAMLVIGNIMEDFSGPDKLKIYGLHKSTGILILFLVFLRFGWRQFTYQPAVPVSDKLPPKLFKWLEFAAKSGHGLIYLLMFLMPISGWIISSGFGFPVSVYGLFTMPNLIAPDKALAEISGDVHGVMANLLIALLVAHIAAALFHHYYLKDVVLKRMLPAIAIILLPLSANAATFEVDKAKSSIRFEAVQNNAPVTGEFKDYTAEIEFDPARLESSKANVEIKIGSLSAAYDEMAASLKGAEWFDVAKFPVAKFVVDKFVYKGTDKHPAYEAHGRLTIREVTKPVILNFTLTKFDSKEAIIDATALIKRNDFGVGQGDWKDTSSVKNEVKALIHLQAKAK